MKARGLRVPGRAAILPRLPGGSRAPMHRPHRIAALLALLALLAAACTAPASRKPGRTGEPVRVAFIDYRSARRLELVNESHTERLEQYSQVRADASRKVQTDEVMAALVEYLDANGLGERAQVGPAPAVPPSGSGLSMAIEVEVGGATSHVPAYRDMAAGDKERVRVLAAAILDTYNATYSLQAVESRPGETPFETPKPPARLRGQLGGGAGGR